MLNLGAFQKPRVSIPCLPQAEEQNQNQLCSLQVLCESPGSPLLPAGQRSGAGTGKFWVFLTPKVFLCTDCHFIGWGYLKSLSWCLSSLLGDTGSPRALCSLWFFVVWGRLCWENQSSCCSSCGVVHQRDTKSRHFSALGKDFCFVPCFSLKTVKYILWRIYKEENYCVIY